VFLAEPWWIGLGAPFRVQPKLKPRPGTMLGLDYVYLLGLYLGDGCISAHPRRVNRLRIVLDVKYPGIITSGADAMNQVRPGPVLTSRRPQNCVEVSPYWKCWPCMFPHTARPRNTIGRLFSWIGSRNWPRGGPISFSHLRVPHSRRRDPRPRHRPK
jgi:hypothetical protein